MSAGRVNLPKWRSRVSAYFKRGEISGIEEIHVAREIHAVEELVDSEEIDAVEEIDAIGEVNAITTRDRLIHQPLDFSEQQIRLMRFQRNQSGVIQCKMENFNFKNCPPYMALSYTWGPPQPLREVMINGTSFQVRENLWRFFDARRDQESTFWLWIDQICINQLDVRERNHQVDLMSNIYHAASKVIIWLGPARSESDTAMALMESWARQRPDYHDEGENFGNSECMWSSAHGSALEALFYRSYWSRLWVLQEIMLAKEIAVLCGEVQISWYALDQFIRTFAKMKHSLLYERFVTRHNIVITPDAVRSIILERRGWGGPDLRLLYVLETFKDLQCEDVRDQVFGLLGIVSPHKAVPIDYSMGPDKLLFSVLEKIYSTDTRAITGFLALGESMRRRLKLWQIEPSRVEDFIINLHMRGPEESKDRKRRFREFLRTRDLSVFNYDVSLPK